MADEDDLYWRLRAGEPAAFRALLAAYHGRLLALAETFLGDRAAAEEVVQESWLAVVEGLDRLERPEALKAWVFSILANKARSRAARERRSAPFSALAAAAGEEGPAVDPARFTKRGFWTSRVPVWDELDPERILSGRQLWEHVRRAIDALPPAQRAVVLLRDMEGLAPAEVCTILDISESNRRVLLHRARARLRTRIEALLETGA